MYVNNIYARSIRPSAKREVQNERSAKRDDHIARPWRAQICELNITLNIKIQFIFIQKVLGGQVN